MFKKIDRRKSAEITTLRKIVNLIGRFGRDISSVPRWRFKLRKQKDGVSVAEEFSHTIIFFLVGIQNNDESNRKSTLRIIFLSIFREIVILLITTFTPVMATTPFWISNNE